MAKRATIWSKWFWMTSLMMPYLKLFKEAVPASVLKLGIKLLHLIVFLSYA